MNSYCDTGTYRCNVLVHVYNIDFLLYFGEALLQLIEAFYSNFCQSLSKLQPQWKDTSKKLFSSLLVYSIMVACEHCMTICHTLMHVCMCFPAIMSTIIRKQGLLQHGSAGETLSPHCPCP